MTNFETLHPRTGGNGPDRTRFAAKQHGEPGTGLSSPAGLEIDDSALTDEDRAVTERVMGMLAESGVAGRLTVGEVAGDGFHAVLDRDGVSVSALITGTTLIAGREAAQRLLLDPEHRNASEVLVSSRSGISVADVREGLDHAVRDARIVNAWTSGPLHSTPSAKYGIPAVEAGYGGAMTASVEVQNGDHDIFFSCTEDGVLEVQLDGFSLAASDAAYAVEEICACTGGKPEDLVRNLQACISAVR